jgi:hypothetical protein
LSIEWSKFQTNYSDGDGHNKQGQPQHNVGVVILQLPILCLIPFNIWIVYVIRSGPRKVGTVATMLSPNGSDTIQPIAENKLNEELFREPRAGVSNAERGFSERGDLENGYSKSFVQGDRPSVPISTFSEHLKSVPHAGFHPFESFHMPHLPHKHFHIGAHEHARAEAASWAQMCPLMAATLGPLAVLLGIPTLTQHWHGQLLDPPVLANGLLNYEILPDPAVNLALAGVCLCCEVMGNFLLVLRFSNFHTKVTTWLSYCFWIGKIVFGIINYIQFGITHPQTDEIIYLQGFWVSALEW